MRLPTDSKRFSEVAGGYQSIVLSLAVLIGGGWTAFAFYSTHAAQLAQLDLEQKRAQRPILQVSMESSILDATVDDYDSKNLEPTRQLFIQVKVSVTNAGNYPTVVDLGKNSLIVSRINSGSVTVPYQTGSRSFDVLGADSKVKTVLLAPGNKTEFLYLVDVHHSGIHTVEFRVPLDPSSWTGMQHEPSAKKISSSSSADEIESPTTVRAVAFVYISPKLYRKAGRSS